VSVLKTTPRQIASTLAEPTAWDSAFLPFRADLGREAHQLIRSEHPDWESEITLKARVVIDGCPPLELRGRADFIRQDDGVTEVIEVKSVCLPPELFSTETTPPNLFSIQAALYAWLLWRNNSASLPEDIASRLICLNLADGNQRSFPVEWSPEYIEVLLADYSRIVEAERLRKARTLRRRRNISKTLVWPYDSVRSAQREMIDSLSTAWSQRDRILIEAPTGCGKTAAILFPVLKKSLSAGRQIYYATAKTGGRSPVTLTVSHFHRQAPDLRSMILSSREEICGLADLAGLCEFCQGDDIEALDPDQTEIDTLFQGSLVTAADVVAWTKSQIPAVNSKVRYCPYRISRLAVDLADLVVGDFNFVFDPAVTVPQFRGDQPLNWALLLDEAHNLPDRAREMMSAKISRTHLTERYERLQDDCWRYDDPVSDEIVAVYLALLDLIDEILSEAPESTITAVEPRIIEWEKLHLEFGRSAGRLIARVGKCLDVDVQTDLWQSYFELKTLAARASLNSLRYLQYADSGASEVGVGCLDASEDLAIQNDRFASLAAFSATLSPMNETARALGLSARRTAFCQIDPPALSEGRLLVVHAPGVETRLKRRPGSAPKVASLISRFARLSPGGVLAVFPSFDYIQLVAPLVEAKKIDVIVQTSGMSAAERSEFKRKLVERSGNLVAFAVAGGQFTEAEDFPGDQVTGVIVVGPCLPPPDFWLNAIRNSHDERGNDGAMIAFLLPAMRKVVQAAGRMLRRDSDHGVILLVDDRYLSEPLWPLLPQGWQNMIAWQSTDWETATADFWGAEVPPTEKSAKAKRRKTGR